MWSKGFVAEETTGAFTRVGKLAKETGNEEAPLDAYYVRSFRSLWRASSSPPGRRPKSFVREAENAARPTEAGVAHRVFGIDTLGQGDFALARALLEHALRVYDPERDREAKFPLRWGL